MKKPHIQYGYENKYIDGLDAQAMFKKIKKALDPDEDEEDDDDENEEA